MAYATAIAIGITWLLARPALAGEDVYVWRDPSGVVRFSSVPEAPTDRREASAAPKAWREQRAPQFVAASEVKK
jgi:hypothetical protein